MPFSDKANTLGITNQSLLISVIKKDIFDTPFRILSRKNVEVQSPVLIDVVNAISLQEFRKLLLLSKNKQSYSKELKEVVRSVVTRCVSIAS